VIALNPVKEFLTAGRVSDVLNTQVHTLLKVSVTNNFVHNDTNSGGGDVVNDTSTPVKRVSIVFG